MKVDKNCLHCLVKQISQKKGHSLKVIGDWDECLQSSEAKI